MFVDDQIEMHTERAIAELDCALDATCVQAAMAHFGLSTLHLVRMQDLKEERAIQRTLETL